MLHLHASLVHIHLVVRLPLQHHLALHALLVTALALPVRPRVQISALQVIFVQIRRRRICNKTCVQRGITASQDKRLVQQMLVDLAPIRLVAPPPQRSIHATPVLLATVLHSVVRLHFRINAQQVTIARSLRLVRHKAHVLLGIIVFLALARLHRQQLVAPEHGLLGALVLQVQLHARHAL